MRSLKLILGGHDDRLILAVSCWRSGNCGSADLEHVQGREVVPMNMRKMFDTVI